MMLRRTSVSFMQFRRAALSRRMSVKADGERTGE
jgi:hypothetical protein